ncbi:hypothetical protein EUA98_08245 [Pengzhenrongella frigida]|uniref:DoxX family protein n=1 Tax=Pengzhenrongella frigida TaxID=1259133 RepID=A0A4Q5N5S9_9MICO|nr:hypothetical protein EUA98_08245 [Cellulomonas sp. HLT2-17]
MLGLAGATHIARPRLYEPLIPRALGNPRVWVLVSGVAELACAAAVAVPRTRRIGALASAALFVAVFPGNVQMALDSRAGADRTRTAITWARLPVQVPLIGWALAVSRRSVRPSRDAAAP